MSNWSPAKQIGSADITIPTTHPFKVSIRRTPNTTISSNLYQYAVFYHSNLLLNTFENNTTYFSYQNQSIIGLNSYENIPNFENKNIYITLDIKVSNLTVTQADINYHIEGSAGLAPFSFSNNYEQTYNQVVLAVLTHDSNLEPASGTTQEDVYIIQKVFTDLIITNIVINNVPVISAVPWGGAPINL